MPTYHVLGGKRLQHWYGIRIDQSDDCKTVTFCSSIHVNREVAVSFSYDATFTDWEILRDRSLVSWAIRRYSSNIFVEQL